MTIIEYDAIMQAINRYKADLENDNVGDMSQADYEYTPQELLAALNRVEDWLIKNNLPQ